MDAYASSYLILDTGSFVPFQRALYNSSGDHAWSSVAFETKFMRGSRKCCQRGSISILTDIYMMNGEMIHYKRTIIGPTAKRHSDDGPILNDGLAAL